jgi:hypothetical protein
MTQPGDLHQRFHNAFEAADLSVDDLWLRYFGLGGDAGRFEIDAYLNGAIRIPPMQHDLLAHAINERLDEIAPPRAPYSNDFYSVDLDGTGHTPSGNAAHE